MAETFPSILCADDDAAVLEELKEYFTLKGFIVLTASNGVEACLQVKRWGPRAVILDLLIPRLGGLGVLGRIHAIDPALPVIMTTDTAEALATVAEAGLSVAGAFAKPLDLDGDREGPGAGRRRPARASRPRRARPRASSSWTTRASSGTCSSSTSAARASRCARRAAARTPWSGSRSSTRTSSCST